VKIVLSWLEEFLEADALKNYTPEQIGETLTSLGLVTESIDVVGPQLDGVVVAEVVKLRSHPNADSIQLVDVNAGSKFNDGADTIQICCGATNMAEGDLVPLATVGTVLGNGMEIAARKMRGEDSNGMLCGPDEIGFAEDPERGLMILEPGLTAGQPLAEALQINSDVVFDLDIEGNRPDALSIAGVARDLAAKIGCKFINKTPKVVEDSGSKAADLVKAKIESQELCSTFNVRVLTDVSVGVSPDWMQQRLTAAGMRPINSIVDISNYVMLELGQPNHTYDLNLVPDGELIVRNAKENEAITTLDDTKRELTANTVVVATNKGEAVGIAGVMGGASTEISDSTTAILLEAAVWDRMSIAKTARKLDLRSEASTRFERGVDTAGSNLALDRFCELAQQICDATVASGYVVAEGKKVEPKAVTVRTAKVNSYLASDLTTEEIASFLNPIGFESKVDGQNLEVQIPSWRPDSSIEVDIIEEVARVRGYDKLTKRVPKSPQSGLLTADQISRRKVRVAVQGMGLSEAMPMPFLAPNDLALAGLENSGISLANPLVADESILRTSLLPGLLKAVSYNQSHRNGAVSLYELGRVYINGQSDSELPVETQQVALLASGFSSDGSAVAQALAWLDHLKAELRLVGLNVTNGTVAGLHPTRSASITFRGKVLGNVGEVDPEVLNNFNVSDRVAWLQLDVDPIVQALSKPPKLKQVSRFPSSDIDLAFNVPKDVGANQVLNTLIKTAGDLLASINLFDVFTQSENDETRSLAYSLRLQAADRTLTDAEVAEIRQNCVNQVEKKHKAQLRS